MPTQILAAGVTAANSSDVVVSAGDELTVALKGETTLVLPGNGVVDVQLKDDGGKYFTVDVLKPSRPALILGAGTYRFARRAGGSCGVFSA